METEFIADRDSHEHTGQTTGCRHGDAEGLILDEQSQPTEGRRLVALLGTEGTEENAAAANKTRVTLGKVLTTQELIL